MKTFIRSLATATPAKKVTQQHVYDVLESNYVFSEEVRQLYAKILLDGPIKTRCFGLDNDEEILDQEQDHLIERFVKHGRLIGAQAARSALCEADLEPKDVDCVVANTCTGYLCPGLSSYLAEDLGLDRTTRVFDIAGMGCGAAIPNLQCASRMVGGDGHVVLSVAVEICSATIFMGPDPDLVVSNCIFGDGASAAVIGSDCSNGAGRSIRLLDFETLETPEERESLRYRSVNGKLRNVLAKRVPVVAGRAVREVAERILDRNGLVQDDIAFWAVHPGGSLVLERIQRTLDLPETTLRFSREVLREYGNMSSASVMFVLERILKHGRPQPKDTCLLLSFGAGFTAFAALVEF